jgi:sulfide:quinone oxidoreductase
MAGARAKRVVICGGGVAAIEALLALRAHMQVGVEIHLVAPQREFVYQPLAVAAPFDLADIHRYDLAEIAARENVQLHLDSLELVDGESRRIVLAGGTDLAYDALLVAVGARPVEWLAGALHFAGADSVEPFRDLLHTLERGEVQRLCFANPSGIAWTLPLYELALLTASHLADVGVIGVELTLVTPETEPLALFGPSAGRALRDLLADRGIALRAGVQAEEISRGELRLTPGGSVEAERVVTLAQLQGPAVPGLPSDADGFIEVDAHGAVRGLADVYAAGDGTTFPVKQGGIATQQADAAAEAIAAGMGAPLEPSAARPTLRGMLLTGIAPVYLRTVLAPGASERAVAIADPLWWPPSKIAGRYLAPYLAGHNVLARSEEIADRAPSDQDPTRLEESHEEARALALAFADRDAADQDFSSALEWLEVIERLDGVLPPGYVEKKAEWGEHTRA